MRCPRASTCARWASIACATWRGRRRSSRSCIPRCPAEFPAAPVARRAPHNLPRELTSFIGREREVGEVRRLLGTTRLLTLTGSGGVGKTRLGLRVAGELVEAYPDGVWLVELAALGDPALVPQATASALGVREQPGRSLLDTLIDVLRPRTCLVLLDNCEHLVAACAALADSLLRACPGLSLLATAGSRSASPARRSGACRR